MTNHACREKGKLEGNGVKGAALFTGLSNYGNEDLKQLGAGMATTGMTSMFYYHEPPRKRYLEVISVEAREIKNTIGCPHCSLSEIHSIVEAIEGRKVKAGTELWVCTSKHVKRKAKSGHVLCDTCPIVAWIKNLE